MGYKMKNNYSGNKMNGIIHVETNEIVDTKMLHFVNKQSD